MGSRLRSVRRVIGAVALVLLAAALAAIWILTEQTVDETSALSAGAARIVAEAPEALAGGGDAAGASDAGSEADGVDGAAPESGDVGEAASGLTGAGGAGSVPSGSDGTENAALDNAGAMSGPATGGAGAAASSASGQIGLVTRAVDWTAANVRRVAHTVEFFCVGLFVSVLGVSLMRGEHNLRWLTPRVFLFCAACSLVDQTHKLFVPGRHFDCVDLAFDAAGYVAGVALALGVAALVRRIGSRRIERAKSPR